MNACRGAWLATWWGTKSERRRQWDGRASATGGCFGLAEGQFDLFVTVDRNLSFQQDVGKCRLGVVVLVAASNRYADLQPLLAGLLTRLNEVAPGQVLRIGA